MSDKKGLILAANANGIVKSPEPTVWLLQEDEMWSVLRDAGLWLGPRNQLEEMPQFKQLIPYIAIKCEEQYVCYTRESSGGEQRLHGKTSIGLGGHIDLSDVQFTDDGIDLQATVELAAEREVREELGDVTIVSKRWLGYIIGDDSPVSQVHIGLAAVWEIAELPKVSAEDEITLRPAATLDEIYAAEQAGEITLESWSAALLDR